MGEWTDENESFDWKRAAGVVPIVRCNGNPFVQGNGDRFEYRRSGRTYRMLQDAFLAAIRGANVWVVSLNYACRVATMNDFRKIVAPIPMNVSIQKGTFEWWVADFKVRIQFVDTQHLRAREDVYYGFARSPRQKLFIDHAVYEQNEEYVRWLWWALKDQKYDGLPTHLYIGKRRERTNTHCCRSWTTYELPSFQWDLPTRWWIQSRRSKGWVLS